MSRLFAIVPVLVLCGCAGMLKSADGDRAAEAEPPPENPMEAFEKVGEPYRHSRRMTDEPDALSSDIERLQDARRAYDAAEDHRAAEVRRRQEKCRESADGQEVVIDDGSEEPGTFCTPAVESSRSE